MALGSRGLSEILVLRSLSQLGGMVDGPIEARLEKFLAQRGEPICPTDEVDLNVICNSHPRSVEKVL